MMIKLRDYQQECLEKIEENFIFRDSQLIQLPTGAGKTIVFLEYIKKIRNKSNKFLVVCPTRDLQEQIIESAKLYFHDKELSSKFSYMNKKLYVVTSQALNFWNMDKFRHDFDLIIFDECHKSASNTYINFLNEYRKKYTFKLLGCTATPERHDRKSLMEIFGVISYEKNILDLICDGYLCDIKAYRILTHQDIKSTYVKNDEFTNKIYKLLDNPTRNKIIIKTYVENCTKKKTLIFCLSIKHAEEISQQLRELNYASGFIHGKMSKTERKTTLNDFKTGKIQVLTNCQLLTEGFDEPSIEALIIARPTRSKPLYIQMIGRGLRKYKNKFEAELYELTDNNFKICTFNVAAGSEATDLSHYDPGTTILQRSNQLLSLEDVQTEIREYKIFDNIFSNDFDFLSNLPQHPSQLFQLEILGFEDSKRYNFLESAFLLWKHKLRVKYGYNY